MDRLPIADAAALDALFAGMPRRAFWPAGRSIGASSTRSAAGPRSGARGPMEGCRTRPASDAATQA